MRAGGDVLSCFEKFESNDFAVAIEIQHDAIGDFFAFANWRVGKAHVECVRFSVIDCRP